MRSSKPVVTLRSMIDPLSQDGAGLGLRVDPLGNVHYDGADSSSDSDGDDHHGTSSSNAAGGGEGGNGASASEGGGLARTGSKRAAKKKKSISSSHKKDAAGGGMGVGGAAADGSAGLGGGAGNNVASVLERTKGLLVDSDGSILPSSLNPTRPLGTAFNTTSLEFTAVPFKRPNTLPNDRVEAGRYAPPALSHAASVAFESEDVVIMFGGTIGAGGGGVSTSGVSSSAAAAAVAGGGGNGLYNNTMGHGNNNATTSAGAAPFTHNTSATKPVNDTWIYSVLDRQWSRLDVLEVVPEALTRSRRARGFSGETLPPPRSGHCAVGIREVQLGVTATSSADAAAAAANSAAMIGGGAGAGNTPMSPARRGGGGGGSHAMTTRDLFLPNRNDTLGASVLFGPQPAQQVLLAGKSGTGIAAASFNGSLSGSASPSSPSGNGLPRGGTDPRDPDPWAYRPSMIVFGGANLSMGVYYNDLWQFDVQCRAWRQLHPGGQAPSPRWKCSAASMEQRVFIFGGETSSYSIVNDLHMFDGLSNMWRSLRVVEPCPRPRMSHSVTVVGDKMIVVGGVDRAAYAERAALLGAGQSKKTATNAPLSRSTSPATNALSASTSPMVKGGGMNGGRTTSVSSPQQHNNNNTGNGKESLLEASQSTRGSTAAFSFSPTSHNHHHNNNANGNNAAISAFGDGKEAATKPIPPLSDIWCLDMRTLLWRELGILDKRNSVFALHEHERSSAAAANNGSSPGGGNNGGGGGPRGSSVSGGRNGSVSSPQLASMSGAGFPPSPSRVSMSIRGGGADFLGSSSSPLRGGGGGGGGSRFFGGSRNSSPRGFFGNGGNGLTMPGAPLVSGYGSLEGHVVLGFNQHLIVHGGLLNGKWNTRLFSFDTVNETWQYHGEINTTGGFSAGDGTAPSTISATAIQPDGGPPTKPQPRAFHCGGTFVYRTCPHSLKQFDTIGKLKEGQIHLSELKETEPLLDFFAVTRAQQIAECGILTIYKNRPVTARTICVFMFGGQSFPRNLSDLWMIRLNDKNAARDAAPITAPPPGSGKEKDAMGRSVTSMSNNSTDNNTIGPSPSAALIATGQAKASLVPMAHGVKSGTSTSSPHTHGFTSIVTSGASTPTRVGTRGGGGARSAAAASSRQALADVLYAASKGGVLQTDPTAALPRLLGGGNSHGGGGGAGANGAGGPLSSSAGGVGMGPNGPSGGAGSAANGGAGGGGGGAGGGGASPINHLRELRRQAARRDDGTYARSQRTLAPEGYFPAVEEFATRQVEYEMTATDRLVIGGGDGSMMTGRQPPPQQQKGDGAAVSGSIGRRSGRNPLETSVTQQQQHQQQKSSSFSPSDDEHPFSSGDDDDDDEDDEDLEAMDAERRQRVEERKRRLVDQLRTEIVNAAHTYMLGGQKVAIRKQHNTHGSTGGHKH